MVFCLCRGGFAVSALGFGDCVLGVPLDGDFLGCFVTYSGLRGWCLGWSVPGFGVWVDR